ncbi:MAG: hypothetical protein Q9M91_04175 [Candidatus Dojkabacteria bacterium]|nr:hypothetical protein [Candidatus Dojkabacteria bacterium]MDQ7021011.1 hypothetical protein [Candidatus Dojkabacteria bacterium]
MGAEAIVSGINIETQEKDLFNRIEDEAHDEWFRDNVKNYKLGLIDIRDPSSGEKESRQGKVPAYVLGLIAGIGTGDDENQQRLRL